MIAQPSKNHPEAGAEQPKSPQPLYRYFQNFVQMLDEQRCGYHEQRTARLGQRAKESWVLLRQTAAAMIRGAGELASAEAVPLLRNLLRQSAGRYCRKHLPVMVRWLDEEVCMWLARQLCDLMPQASDRLWGLLPLTQSVQPSWRACAFLKRVSRCYIFGFDAECLIMCRSALEGAFEAEITDEECERTVGGRPWADHLGQSVYDLHTRIAVARKLGRITPATASDAQQVRAAARRVIHHKPKVVGDPRPFIAKTIHVVRELAHPPASEPPPQAKIAATAPTPAAYGSSS